MTNLKRLGSLAVQCGRTMGRHNVRNGQAAFCTSNYLKAKGSNSPTGNFLIPFANPSSSSRPPKWNFQYLMKLVIDALKDLVKAIKDFCKEVAIAVKNKLVNYAANTVMLTLSGGTVLTLLYPKVLGTHIMNVVNNIGNLSTLYEDVSMLKKDVAMLMTSISSGGEKASAGDEKDSS